MKKGFRQDDMLCEYVRAVYPRENKEIKLQQMKGQEKGIWIFMAVLILLSVLYCLFLQPEHSLIQENEITRLEGDTAFPLEVTAFKDGKEWREEVIIDLNQRKYTEEEMNGLEQRTENYLAGCFPGDNSSLTAVDKPLAMVKSVPDTGVALEWMYDEAYIREDGSLIAPAIPKEGVDTEVSVRAESRNWEKTFTYFLHLMPVKLTEEQQVRNQIKTAVANALTSQETKAVVELPEQIGNMQVQYSEKQEKSYGLLLVMLLACGCVPFALRERRKKKMEARDEQMMADHPGLVNKIMLLLGAGLTFRKCVERLTEEYERERKRNGGIRYAYEELCILNQEMRDGCSEAIAVERFGKRCRLLPYIRFSTVISQNIKKGAEGILEILEKESMEALEQRKERVLQMGEKAGTKLLFPMMIMLGLVMGIIMIPAFMTM